MSHRRQMTAAERDCPEAHHVTVTPCGCGTSDCETVYVWIRDDAGLPIVVAPFQAPVAAGLAQLILEACAKARRVQ